MKTIAIIPSGGIGKRINSSLPKQYISVNGKELISYTLNVFQQCNLVNEIVVAAQPDYFDLLENIKQRDKILKLTNVVKGGLERQTSVYNAMKSLDAGDEDLIIVHDAARPLLPPDILTNAIKSAEKFDNIVVALKAKDTLVKGDSTIEEYIERDDIYYVQTPQIFRYKILIDAMIKAENENFLGTDESMLVKRASYKINIIEGSSLNFKITTNSDLDLFRLIVNIGTY